MTKRYVKGTARGFYRLVQKRPGRADYVAWIAVGQLGGVKGPKGQVKVRFSVKKYGEAGAKARAKVAREEMVKRLLR